jgi:hypothetical protein
MIYIGGGTQMIITPEAMQELFSTIEERVRRGIISEYKRIICFDRETIESDHQLKAGVVRVGDGPGTIHPRLAEHCRWMLGMNGCFLYVAPVILRAVVGLYGRDKAGFSFETIDPDDGLRKASGVMVFSDPPNGEIIEQFRQLVRTTERRTVAVREIRFLENAAPATVASTDDYCAVMPRKGGTTT